MDPINFTNHGLPKMEYNVLRKPQYYYVEDDVQYADFLEEFVYHVKGDCHAIAVDNEIIFNNYGTKLIRETIQDFMIRDNISANPHVLFVDMFRKNIDTKVILYMFGLNPWFLTVYYKADQKILTIEYYKSKAYISKYEAGINPLNA